MVELSEVQLFKADEHKRQRSIIFAIVLATGFLTVASGAATLATATNTAVGAVLLVLGVVLLAASAAVAMGSIDEYLFE